MISELGWKISAVFRRTAPDPLVLAVLLTGVTALLGLAFGFPAAADGSRPDLAARALGLLDAWRAGDGVWKFLAFSMQMCLILVTGSALAASRPVRRLIEAVAAVPSSTRSGAAFVVLFAGLASLLNWGLGLIVGALLAREVGRSLARRGIPAHYPLLAAAGYAGFVVWHGGLSGSAPLSMTTPEGAAKVLPAAEVARLGGEGVPLTDTLFSPLNLFVSGGLLVLLPLLLSRLAPERGREVEPIDAFRPAEDSADDAASGGAPASIPDRLERSAVPALLLAALLLFAVVRYGVVTGFDRIGLNEINLAMLGLGLLLHGSLRSYRIAIEDGVRGCAGIILQFPLYAGIMGMMVSSGLVASFASALAELGSQTVPLWTFASAGVVNLFVPSGGGQWGIQGPIALEAGLAAGVPAGKMVMSVAYGDQLTNLLQPFWALPLLAITGVRARDIVGYTAIVMIAVALWMMLGLVLF